MLPTPKVIKLTAQENLKNNWAQAISVALILFTSLFLSVILIELCGTILNISSSFSPIKAGIISVPTLIMFVFNLPLLQGVIRFFWYMPQQTKLPISEVFYYYSSIKLAIKTVFLHMYLVVKTICLSIVFYIPAFVVFSLSEIEILNSLKMLSIVPSLLVKTFGWGLVLVATFLSIKNALNYILAPVIFISNEGKDYEFTLNISKNIARKNKTAFSTTFYSFLGLIILSLLGIPAVFTLPFLLMSYVVFSRFALVNYGITLN